MDHLGAEIDSLIHAFDGLKNDLDDLLSMKKALKLYRECYSQFINEALSWEDFDQLSSNLTKEYGEILEEEEVPWPPDEVIGKFYNLISQTRQSKSQNWMSGLESHINHVASLTASEANQLMRKVQNPPPYLTNHHRTELEQIIIQVDKRLNDLSVEWLVEKFKELSPDGRLEFIEMIKPMLTN